MKERIDHICKCARKIYLGNADRGIIEFGGWLLNLKDFSAVAFEDTKINVSYK